MDNMRFICVDMQNDFASEGGMFYKARDSVNFLHDELIPHLKKCKIKMAEIVSDYRQPRPGDPRDCCRPGEWGYDSVIPRDVVSENVWVKTMNSPVWTRDNAGIKDAEPGLPRPDMDAFKNWLEDTIGQPGPVILVGLTLDRCILSTAQELTYLGYQVKVLEEGTDTASGDLEEKEYLLYNPPLIYWAEALRWADIKSKM